MSLSFATPARRARKTRCARRWRAKPVRGELQLDPGRPGWHRGQRKAPKLAGLVIPGDTRWALPPLDQATVEKIRGPNLLVLGYEEIVQNRRTVEVYRQAWWCRIVTGGDLQLDVDIDDVVPAMLDRIASQREHEPAPTV